MNWLPTNHSIERPGCRCKQETLELPCLQRNHAGHRTPFCGSTSASFAASPPTNPAEVFRRISPCHAPCCLRPRSEGSAFGFQYSRGPTGLLALGPGDSLAILIIHRRSQGRSISASALRSRFFASMLADSRLFSRWFLRLLNNSCVLRSASSHSRVRRSLPFRLCWACCNDV